MDGLRVSRSGDVASVMQRRNPVKGCAEFIFTYILKSGYNESYLHTDGAVSYRKFISFPRIRARRQAV